VLVNASSCEIFAGAVESPQTETTGIRPISPYGAAKAFGHNLCHAYRAKGLTAINMILYNHESPRRPAQFVTRKITSTVAAIAKGRADRLVLGVLTIRRDWGWAPDYVRAMLAAARRGAAEDYVIATGRAHSIADFAAAAFTAAGLPDWQRYVVSDDALRRPADSATLVGDATKAADVLDWSPSMPFEAIVAAMVAADLRQEQHA
jgi:GDPmannose 4,6-dehydratase